MNKRSSNIFSLHLNGFYTVYTVGSAYHTLETMDTKSEPLSHFWKAMSRLLQEEVDKSEQVMKSDYS